MSHAPTGGGTSPAPQRTSGGGANAMFAFLGKLILAAAIGGSIVFAFMHFNGDDSKESHKKGTHEEPKPDEGAKAEVPRFGDERDDQSSDVSLSSEEKATCRLVIIVDGKRKGVDIDEWQAAYDKDEAYGTSHPLDYAKSGRPIVVTKLPSDKNPMYYAGTFDKDWHVTCDKLHSL